MRVLENNVFLESLLDLTNKTFILGIFFRDRYLMYFYFINVYWSS